MEKTTSLSSSQKRFAFTYKSRWAGLVPVGITGIFAALMWGRPVAKPLVFQAPVEVISPSGVTTNPVLPASATLVVGNAVNARKLSLRGHLTAFKATPIVAPISGMIARLPIKKGQIVASGDTIAMISNQAMPAKQDKKVAAQEKAEAAQVDAARQQAILRAKLEQEQQSLKIANQRLNKASTRLTEARELVHQLQNQGNQKGKIDSSGNNETNTKNIASTLPPVAEIDDTELKAARQQANDAAKHAAQKWQDLHVLLSRQAAAKATAKSSANTNGASANATTPEPPSTQDISNARKAAQQAQEMANATHSKVNKMEQSRKTSSISTANIPSDKTNRKTNEGSDNKPISVLVDGKPITAADAARIAQAALKESREAMAQVEAIQNQIARYRQPVENTANRIQETTSHLDDVQRALFDNPARVQMTSVVATASGMIGELAALATQVEQGDEVASVVPPNLLLLELRDNSGLWRKMKADDRLEVNVQIDDKGNSVLSAARLIDIRPPEKEGGTALLRLQVFNPPQPDSKENPDKKTNDDKTDDVTPQRQFAPGMTAVCWIPIRNAAIAIPQQALMMDEEGSYQVAVLQPTLPAEDKVDGKYTVEWREVTVQKNANDSQHSVVSGLADGERIALHPQDIYQRLTGAKKEPVIVQVRGL